MVNPDIHPLKKTLKQIIYPVFGKLNPYYFQNSIDEKFRQEIVEVNPEFQFLLDEEIAELLTINNYAITRAIKYCRSNNSKVKGFLASKLISRLGLFEIRFIINTCKALQNATNNLKIHQLIINISSYHILDASGRKRILSRKIRIRPNLNFWKEYQNYSNSNKSIFPIHLNLFTQMSISEYFLIL